jgi:hypothetical protein
VFYCVPWCHYAPPGPRRQALVTTFLAASAGSGRTAPGGMEAARPLILRFGLTPGFRIHCIGLRIFRATVGRLFPLTRQEFRRAGPAARRHCLVRARGTVLFSRAWDRRNVRLLRGSRGRNGTAARGRGWGKLTCRRSIPSGESASLYMPPALESGSISLAGPLPPLDHRAPRPRTGRLLPMRCLARRGLPSDLRALWVPRRTSAASSRTTAAISGRARANRPVPRAVGLDFLPCPSPCGSVASSPAGCRLASQFFEFFGW